MRTSQIFGVFRRLTGDPTVNGESLNVRYEKSTVTARLRAVAAQSNLTSKGRALSKVPWSSAAITARLRRQSELRKLCLELGSLERI